MQDSSFFEIQHILPEIVLSVFGIAVMLLDTFLSKANRYSTGALALVGILVTALSTLFLVNEEGSYMYGMTTVDDFGMFFRFTFLVIGALTILGSLSYLRREKLVSGEYLALILFAIAGMNLMVTSNELIMIFLGLETLSIASYILLGVMRTNLKSNESALKYFLLGSFSSAFLLYGIALIYGVTRTTNLELIGREIARGNGSLPILYLAAALMLVGCGFKIAISPFHVWTPDVYEGAPTPITAFMSVGPKAAGFAILFRVFFVAFPALANKWLLVTWILAVLTMCLGNFAAIVQNNIKRMLAYSSIAHAGYILVAFVSGNPEGEAAALFYLLAYALMNLGAFAIVTLVGGEGDQKVQVDDFAGLGVTHPALAASLSVFLLSLAGIPLTAGFTGKFFIFRSALESRHVWLTVIGVLNSAISVYYYLRVIVSMYMKEPAADSPQIALSSTMTSVLLISVLGVFALGIFPDWAINLARNSVLNLR
ncbi:MAG: NADH-quinone oxidoreductase subunit N [Terriglobia bacterium]